ncbi:acetyl-CoA carboxylase family protein [Henriciella mobilis]|uniref:ATP-grasp domain-containing protein n=1 Tax=Henriciella mobilis TaxID=2305467 RepID=A0A399REN6_9PROT|nr:carboxyl transferase domain-containing protein [Henriciella mobilis]RIJ29868.1 ATP-grasp domain-containing protein [Henriciella mobilis]
MSLSRILIANRGEIAVRVARAAIDMDIECVGVHSSDDAESLHTRMVAESIDLGRQGPAAYLDSAAIVEAALKSGCDSVHPGYGFLSENHDFAQQCVDAGLAFIGPRPDLLKLFGDKAAARQAAAKAGVETPRGIDGDVGEAETADFLDGLGGGGAIIKAVAGGGGRGTRIVHDRKEIAEALKAVRSEARTAFGNERVYAEEFLPHARHIEVQIVADNSGAIAHLGERDCSLQRRNQKLVEIAPAPDLGKGFRAKIIEAAMALAGATQFSNIGTFEFLVDEATSRVVFIETNPRLQVEHTVTEVVTGIDLVQSQIRLAGGARLQDIGLKPGKGAPVRGVAIQARINMETISADGQVRPCTGQLAAYDPPSGPGIRTDGFAYAGYETSGLYDSLLAKVIAGHTDADTGLAVRRLIRALEEFRITGVGTNIGLLQAILAHSDAGTGRIHTRWVEQSLKELLQNHANPARSRFVQTRSAGAAKDASADANRHRFLPKHGGEVDANLVIAPVQGTIVSVEARVGDRLQKGESIAVLEAMKMEHAIAAEHDCIIVDLPVSAGDLVALGATVARIDITGGSDVAEMREDAIDPATIRPDLQDVFDRHAITLDAARPNAVKRRHEKGGRTPRENIEDLVDPGSFLEYEPLIVAQQHGRLSAAELRVKTPCDGIVAGTATVNSGLFGEAAAKAMVLHYDYSVLAGTQGNRGHRKQDRMFELAERFGYPVIMFSEGGGGRPGEDDTGPEVYFDIPTFSRFSRLSGSVPLVGVNHGRCFAGNTALLAACDVIIATEDSTIALGGPAMIEGGGLGRYAPEEVGPMSVQVPNGTVDILVSDEAAAVSAAKTYLSYFQGRTSDWESHDQRLLRHIVPENRKRAYDMRRIVELVADIGSVLEIREHFGRGLITSFARVEGHPVGIIANNPMENAGAIDSDCADKGARFMQLCDAFDIPVLSLIDCPGMMVGPDVEATALVRHAMRMFNTGANLTTPLFNIVIRKAYGLGVLAMCGGCALNGLFTLAWPTAEFAAMNLQGAVKLGFRKELEAIGDETARQAELERRVAEAEEKARAVNAAAGGGLDDVIDPAMSRDWIAAGLNRLAPQERGKRHKYPFVDTW